MANPAGKRRPKTAPNGAGTLIEIDTPYGRRYRAVSTLDIGGKVIRVSGEGVSPSEAFQRRAKNIYKRLNPKQIEKSVVLEDFLRGWIKELNPDEISDSVRKAYANHLELHVIPYFGKLGIKELTREQCRDHFAITLKNKAYDLNNPEKRLSSYALKSIHSTFKRSMTWAQNEGIITTNPMANVPAPRIKRKKVVINEAAPEKLMYELMGDPEQLRWLIAFFGIRQSEALGLTWDKVSTDKKFILIEQQLLRKETFHGCGHRTGKDFPCGKQSASACPKMIGERGWEIREGAKTEAGNRKIPLTPLMAKLFIKQKIRQDKAKEAGKWKPLPGLDNLVFTDEKGHPRKHQQDTALWHALLKKHNIPYQRGHISRHTTATILASMKPEIPIGIVKEILGHNSTAMTEYYTHRNAELTREPMAALENQIMVTDYFKAPIPQEHKDLIMSTDA